MRGNRVIKSAKLKYYNQIRSFNDPKLIKKSSGRPLKELGTKFSVTNLCLSVKICAQEVAIPLQIIFQRFITPGMFADYWECASVQPVHIKGTNYRSISLTHPF